MPSKMQHELNRIRGKTIIKEEKYTDTIAELKEKIVTLEKEVLILDEEKIKHLSKINKIKTLSKNAYQRATEQHDEQRHKKRLRKILINNSYYYNTAVAWNGYLFDSDAVEIAYFKTKLPEDFTKIEEINILWMRDGFEGASKNWVADIKLYYDSLNETAADDHNDELNKVINVPANELLKNRSTSLTSSMSNNLKKNHYLTFELQRDAVHASDTVTFDIAVFGIEIIYIADM